MEDNDPPPPPPRRRTSGEFLFQLATITIGVLIALAFDGLLQWNKDRSLVETARANIAREIADNKLSLENHLAKLDGMIGKISDSVAFIDEILSNPAVENREISVSVVMPELGDAAWRSAERTGALALMEFDDVQNLSLLYALQDMQSDQRLRVLELLPESLAYFWTSESLPELPAEDLRAARERLLSLRSSLVLHQQLSEGLGAAYARLGTVVTASSGSE